MKKISVRRKVITHELLMSKYFTVTLNKGQALRMEALGNLFESHVDTVPRRNVCECMNIIKEVDYKLIGVL